MGTRNTATWTRGRFGGWELVVHFARHWEAPAAGDGEGTVHTVQVVKRGKPATTERVRLTSRCFDRGGERKAFAVPA